MKVITSLGSFLFDFRLNRALRNGWKIKSMEFVSGFLGRLVIVATLEK